MVLSGAASGGGVHLPNGVPIASGQEPPNGSRIARPGTKSNFGFPGNMGYHRQAAGERGDSSLPVKNGLSTTPRNHTQRSPSPELIQFTGRRAGPSPRDRSQSYDVVEHAPIMLSRRSSSAKQLSVAASTKEPSLENPQGSAAPAHKRTASARLTEPRKTGVFGSLFKKPGTLSDAATVQQREAGVQSAGSRGQPDPEDGKVARSANAARRGSQSPRQMAYSRGPGEAPTVHSGLPARRRSPSPTERADPSPCHSAIASRRRSPSPSPRRDGSFRKIPGGPSGRSPSHDRESDAPAATAGLLARRVSPSPRGQGVFMRGSSGGEAVLGGQGSRRGSPTPRGQAASMEGMEAASSVEHGRRSPSAARVANPQTDRKAPASRLRGGHASTGSGRKLPSPRAAGPADATRGGASARALPSPRKQANGQARMSTRAVLTTSGAEQSASRSSLMPSPSTDSRRERRSASATASRSLLSAVAPGRNALLGTDARSRRGASSIAVPSGHPERPSSRQLSPPRDQDAADSRLRAAAGATPSSHDAEPSGTRGINAASGRLLSTTPRSQAASKEALIGQSSSKSWKSAQSRAVESASSRQVRSLTPSKLGRANTSGKLMQGRESAAAETADAGMADAFVQRNAAVAQRQAPVVSHKHSPLSPKDRHVAAPASTRPATTSPRKVEEMAFLKSTAGSQVGSQRRSSSSTPRRQSMSPRPRKESPTPQIAFSAVRQAASALPGKHTGLLMRKDQSSSTAASAASRIQRDAGTRKQANSGGELMFTKKASGTKGEQAGSDRVVQTIVRNGGEMEDGVEDGGFIEESGSAELPRDAACSGGYQRNNPFRKEMSKVAGGLTFPKQSVPAPGQLRPASARFEKSVSSVRSVSESRMGKESGLKKHAASQQQGEHGPTASGRLAGSLRAARNASPRREPSAAPENCTAKVMPTNRKSPRTGQASTVQSGAARAKVTPGKTKVAITPRGVAESPREEHVATPSRRVPGVRSAKALASAGQVPQSPSTKQMQSASALQRGTFILRERVREKVSNLLKEMGSSLPGRRTMSAPAAQSDGGIRKGSSGRQGLSFRKRASSDGNLAGLEVSPEMGKHPAHGDHDANQVAEKGRAPPAVTTTPRGKKIWQHGMSLLKSPGPSGRHSVEPAATDPESPRIADSAAASAPVVGSSHEEQSPATVRQTDGESRSLSVKHSAEPVEESVVPTKGQRTLTGSSASPIGRATSPAKPSSRLSAPHAGRLLAPDAGERPEVDQHQTTPPSGVLTGHLSPKAGIHRRVPVPGGHDVGARDRPQSPSPARKRQESPFAKPSGLRGQSGRPASPSGVSVGHAESFSGFVPSQSSLAGGQPNSPLSVPAGRPASPQFGMPRQPMLPASGATLLPASRSPAFGQRPTSPSSRLGIPSDSPSLSTGRLPASPSAGIGRLPRAPSPDLLERPESTAVGTGRRPSSPSFGLAERPASPKLGASRQVTPPASGIARPGPSLSPPTERPASPVFGIGRPAGRSGIGRRAVPTSSLLGGQPPSLPADIGRDLPSLVSGVGQPEPPLFAIEERPASPLFGSRRQPTVPSSVSGELPHAERPTESASPRLGGLPGCPKFGPAPTGEVASAVPGQAQATESGLRPMSSASTAVGADQPSQLALEKPRGEARLGPSGGGDSSHVSQGLRALPDAESHGAGVCKPAGGLLDSVRNVGNSINRNIGARSTASVPSSPAPVGSNELLRQVVAPTSPADPQVEGCEECLTLTDPKEDVESVQLSSTALPSLRQQAEGRYATFGFMRRSTKAWQQSQDPDGPCSLGLPPSPVQATSFEDVVEDEEESRGASCSSLEGCDPPMTGSLLSTEDSQMTVSQEARSDLDLWDPLDTSPDPIAVEELSEGEEKCEEKCDERNAQADVKDKSQVKKEAAVLEDLPSTFSDEDALSSLSLSSLVKDDCPSPPRVSGTEFEAGNPFYGVTDLSSDDDVVTVSTVQGRSVVPVPPEAWREDLFSPRRNPLFEQWAMLSAKAGAEQQEDSQDSDLPTRVDAVILRSDSVPVHKERVASESGVWPAGGTRSLATASQLPKPFEGRNLDKVQHGSNFFSLLDDSCDRGAQGANGSRVVACQKQEGGFREVFRGDVARAQGHASPPLARREHESSSPADSVWPQSPPPRESFDSEAVEMSISGPARASSVCSQSRVSEASDTASVESSSTFVFKPPVVDSKLESEFLTWQDTNASSEFGASCEPPDCNDPDLWSRPPRCPGASETSISTKELMEESQLAEAGTSGADVEKSMDSSDIHSSVFEYTFDSMEEGGAPAASKSAYGQFQQKSAQSRIQNMFYGCSTVDGPPHMPRRGIPPPTNFAKVSGDVDEPNAKWATDEVKPKTADAAEATELMDVKAPPAVSLTRNASSGSMSDEAEDDDEGILPPTPDAESNGKRVFGKSESDSCESRAALGFHYSSPPVNIESIDEDAVLKTPYDSPRPMAAHKDSPAPCGTSGNGDGRMSPSSCADAGEIPGMDRTDSTAGVQCCGDVYYEKKGGLLGDDDDVEDLEDAVVTDSPRSKDADSARHGFKLLKRQGAPGGRRSPFAAADKAGSSSKKLCVQNWLTSSGPKSQCSDSLLSSNSSSQGPGAREPEFGPDPQSSDAYHSRAESFDSSTQVSQSESGLSMQFTPKDEPVEAAFPQEGPSSRLRSASHRQEDSRERALLRGGSSSGANVVCGLSSAPLADVLEDSPFEESATHSSAVSFTDYRDSLGNRVGGRQRKSYSVSSEIEVDDAPPSSRHAARRMQRSASASASALATTSRSASGEASMMRKSSSGSLMDKLRRKISLSHSRRSSMGSTPRKEPREGVREFGCFAFLSPRTPRRGASG